MGLTQDEKNVFFAGTERQHLKINCQYFKRSSDVCWEIRSEGV